jgi:hypothetical protein
MSDRSFLSTAQNLTKEWDAYVAALQRLANLCVETQVAVQELASARDRLAAAVLEEADVSS